MVLRTGHRPSWYTRLLILALVGLARLLARLSPLRLRRVLERVRRGARPATEAVAQLAWDDVVGTSVRCAGEWCLQRSVAVALLCRVRGCWPEWRTGVRLQPFRAHAWISVDGRAIGEHPQEIPLFRTLMFVPPC